MVESIPPPRQKMRKMWQENKDGKVLLLLREKVRIMVEESHRGY